MPSMMLVRAIAWNKHSHIILIVFRAFIQMGCMCLMANTKDWDCPKLKPNAQGNQAGSPKLIRYTVNGKGAFRSGSEG
jgi:hypothetical protein